MCYLNGWHPFESIGFDLVKITKWRCLVLQIWEQQKQLLRKQRVIQQISLTKMFEKRTRHEYEYAYTCSLRFNLKCLYHGNRMGFVLQSLKYYLLVIRLC